MKEENREMQNKLIEFTAENKVLEMQVQELKNRNADINLSFTKESIYHQNENRKDIESDILKRRCAEMESQVRQLKDDLHKTKVDKEKYADKYEATLEENRLLKDQMFNMKKFMLELEKKDFSLVQNIRELETSTQAKLTKNRISSKRVVEAETKPEEKEKQVKPQRAESPTDDRPIRPIKKAQLESQPEKSQVESQQQTRSAAKYRNDMYSSHAVSSS